MSGVKIYYLEMKERTALKAKPKPNGLDVVEAEVKEYRFNRFLYQLVGEPWQWTDKLKLTEDEWQHYAESDNVRTWVGYYQGAIVGYYELEKQLDSSVEIKYFGLAPKFIGKGFGGYLLSKALTDAWEWDEPERVWVHTCSLDHPSALNNYQARGLTIYHTELE